LIYGNILKSPLTPLYKRGEIINMFHVADIEWVRVCNKNQKCSYIKFSQKLYKTIKMTTIYCIKT